MTASRPTSQALRLLTNLLFPIYRVFHRIEAHGLDHLPAQGPYILVSNHNAGLGIAELVGLAALWAKAFGGERPLAAGRVDFGGRKGWAKIATSVGIPVIPMAIRGSHFTCPIFWRSRWLAWFFVIPRLAGIKRWAITLTGILGALALLLLPVSWWVRGVLIYLWLGTPGIFLPLIPWKISYHLGPVISANSTPDELYDEVVGAVQSLLK